MLRVTVPATSANLGPGYDALGLAVQLRLQVTFEASAEDRFHYRGEGAIGDTPDNLVHQGFRAVHRHLGLTPPPATFTVDNPIPLARGLGSSSAALVAGAALANGLHGQPLSHDELFQLTAAMEGHPDNVAPAVFGGFTVSARSESGRFESATLPIPPSWRLLFGVPAFELSTAKAREVVPATFARADVVLTSSRAALWVAAVAADRPELLRTASLDVVHQPHRAPLIPGFLRACSAATTAGAFAVFLSGAGPTVCVVCSAAAAARCESALAEFAGEGGRVLDLAPAPGFTLEGG